MTPSRLSSEGQTEVTWLLDSQHQSKSSWQSVFLQPNAYAGQSASSPQKQNAPPPKEQHVIQLGTLTRLFMLVPTTLTVVMFGLLGSLVVVQFSGQAFSCESWHPKQCLLHFSALPPHDILRAASLAFLVPGVMANAFFLSGFCDLQTIAGLFCMPRHVHMPFAAVSLAFCALMLAVHYMATLPLDSINGPFGNASRLHDLQDKTMEAIQAVQADLLKHHRSTSEAFHYAFLCTIAWAVALPLSSLWDQGLLKSHKRTFLQACWRVLLNIVFQAFRVVVLLIVFDIVLSRINFLFQLQQITHHVHTLKLADSAEECDGVMLQMAKGRFVDSNTCIDFCLRIEELATERQEMVNRVREAHPTGHYAAEFFEKLDGGRHRTTEEFVEDLFKEKPCSRVLKSVDRASWKANAFILLFGSICLLLALYVLMALGSLVDGLVP
jgi:hypothetical protein